MSDKRENLIEKISKGFNHDPQMEYFENIIRNNLSENDINEIYKLVKVVKKNPYYQAYLLYNLIEIREKQKCGK